MTHFDWSVHVRRLPAHVEERCQSKQHLELDGERRVLLHLVQLVEGAVDEGKEALRVRERRSRRGQGGTASERKA